MKATRFRTLYVADFFTLLAILFASLVIRFGTSWPKSFSTYCVGFLIAVLIHLIVYYFGELYEPSPRIGARSFLPRVTALTAFAILIDATLALISGFFLMPRANLVAFGVFGSLGIAFNRWLSHRVRNKRFGRPRVLLVGTDADIALGSDHILMSEPEIVVAGMTNHPMDLTDLVRELSATDILLMSAGGLNSVYPTPLAEIEKRRIGIFQRVIPSDTLLGLKRTLQIGGMPFIALRAHSLSKPRSTLKRTIELFYLSIGLIPLLVTATFIAGYVRVLAGKNIIYRQERTGKFGETFMMLKFRTMTENAEAETGVIKADYKDSRVIKGLDWVRKTRLDEIPQFINVLKGEMSIIGPRPERPDFTGQYQMEIPGYERRHDIPPGITGLAQVKGRYHTDPAYKLGHDLQYLVNWSPILDIQILFQTIWTILIRRQ
tara:strand:+ start:569 stop:1867 length:1299 start_codon:yes stop_codon:yes gene_type:complete